MTAPRLDVRLDRIAGNAAVLVGRTRQLGISVTGVTKAMLGHPELAATLLDAGVAALGDSRIESVETMQAAGVAGPMFLLRSPSPSQVDRIVESGVTSLNVETEVIDMLSVSARSRGVMHRILLMVELGDLREGVMADQLESTVREVLALSNVELVGLGANLACRSGVEPDATNMGQLSDHAHAIEHAFGIELEIISGGNSANLAWVFGGADTGRVNNLRIGEAILLGRDPLHRRQLDHLHTDALTLIGEVIESQRKPSKPWGSIGQAAFGPIAEVKDRGDVWQTIVALGHQDTDPQGLTAPEGVTIVGASSDHLVTETDRRMSPGSHLGFQPNYSALVRSMTSPFVLKVLHEGDQPAPVGAHDLAAGF